MKVTKTQLKNGKKNVYMGTHHILQKNVLTLLLRCRDKI